MAIAIAIKPVPESAVPKGPGDPMSGGEMGGETGGDDGVGQDIVEQCKQLPPDDLTTLQHGISPEAADVMSQIPELAPFADYIQNGSQPASPDAQTAAPAKMSARDSVAQAMGQNGVKGPY